MTAPHAPIPEDDAARRPLWRIPAMWLVIGGPAIAVVASLGTTVVAYRGADRVVTQPHAVAAESADESTTPAEQARNHVNVPRH